MVAPRQITCVRRRGTFRGLPIHLSVVRADGGELPHLALVDGGALEAARVPWRARCRRAHDGRPLELGVLTHRRLHVLVLDILLAIGRLGRIELDGLLERSATCTLAQVVFGCVHLREAGASRGIGRGDGHTPDGCCRAASPGPGAGEPESA
eukprot:scaffold67026_cov28-Tisochrysis_lutea.AAC.1